MSDTSAVPASLLLSVLANVADAVLVSDSARRVLYMNPAAEALTRWSFDSAHQESIDRVAPLLDRALDRMLDASVAAAFQPARLARRDGTTAVVEYRMFRSGPAELHRSVLLVRDRTDDARAADALKTAEGELLHARKLETLGRLVGSVTHDFSNILSVVIGDSEMLLERDGSTAAGEERILLGEIQNAGARGAALTRHLLAFTRKHPLELRVFDLNEVLTDVEPLLRRAAGDSVTLRMNLGRGLPALHADPDQIKIAVMNLVLNARDAMPSGGSVTIRTTPREGTDVGLGPRFCADLVVEDSGTGMDESTKARAFEPFFTTHPESGTGLGLSIVRSVVKNVGGRISVASTIGRGTAVTLHLPGALRDDAVDAMVS